MRGDTRNHVLSDPYVYVVFWGPSLNGRSEVGTGLKRIGSELS